MKRTFLREKLRQNDGMSLVELLVAVAIGLVLLGGVYQVFLSSDTGYRYNQEHSRLQENSRFLVDYLTREVRMSGYMGCATQIGSYINILNSTDFIYDFGQPIYGLEATSMTTAAWADGTGAVDPTQTADDTAINGITSPLAGSDILVLRGINPNMNIQVTGHMDNVSADLKITSGIIGGGILPAVTGEILIVTDCIEATVFQATNYTDSNGNLVHNTGVGTPGNSTKDFGHEYSEDAEILIPRTLVFYIRNNGSNEPSLYFKNGSAAVQELVPGVENMQVLYGVDNNDDQNVDDFVPANDSSIDSDWGNVLAVRIGFLLRSQNEIAKKGYDTATYTVNGTANIDPIGNGTVASPADDRRLRQVLVTTVGIRNRLP